MKRKIEFYEVQAQKQWWMRVLMIGINIPFLYGFVWQIIMGNSWGNNPMSDTELIILMLIIILFSILYLISKLKTHINDEGIYIHYFPFLLKTKFYAWDDVERAYIRSYKAIREYGGWGVRRKLKEKAIIISGNQGLQLELKNGKKLLIGTQQSDEIEKEVISKLK